MTTQLSVLRSVGFTMASALLLSLGCDRAKDEAASDDATFAVAQEALEESSSSEQETDIAELAFPTESTESLESTAAAPPADALPVPSLTAQQRIDNVKAWVKARLSCATATDISGGAKIQFTKDCQWNGKRWTGDVSIVYTKGDTATITFSGLALSGLASTEGTLTVTKLGQDHVTVTGERTTNFGAHTVVATLSGEYKWDEESVSIVTATRTRTVDGITATQTTTGIHWLRSEVSPEAGTIVRTTLKGNTYTVTFSREADSGNLLVTVVSPRGTKTFSPDELVDA